MMERSLRGSLVVFTFIVYMALTHFAYGMAILHEDNRLIRITEETKYYSSGTSNYWEDSKAPQIPFEFFDEYVGSPFSYYSYASQLSTITSTLFEATGEVFAAAALNVEGSSGSASRVATAESLFEVRFELLEPHRYDLSASGAYHLYIEGIGLGLILDTSGSVDQNSILQPGSYLLSLSSWASVSVINGEFDGTSINSYDFSFEIKPAESVPEPSIMWLLCCSFFGIMGFKKSFINELIFNDKGTKVG